MYGYSSCVIEQMIDEDEYRVWRERANSGKPFEFMSRWFSVSSIRITDMSSLYGKIHVKVELWETSPPPKPKTERQIALEQAIKIHKLNIEHNKLMIQKYEKELKNES